MYLTFACGTVSGSAAGLALSTMGEGADNGSVCSSTVGDSTINADAIGSALGFRGDAAASTEGDCTAAEPGEEAGTEDATTDPATAAAYRIGGSDAFGAGTGTVGTGGGGSDLPTILIGSAFVLSIVDLREGCFLP